MDGIRGVQTPLGIDGVEGTAAPALQHDPIRPEDVLKVDADEDGVGGATRRMR